MVRQWPMRFEASRLASKLDLVSSDMDKLCKFTGTHAAPSLVTNCSATYQAEFSSVARIQRSVLLCGLKPAASCVQARASDKHLARPKAVRVCFRSLNSTSAIELCYFSSATTCPTQPGSILGVTMPWNYQSDPKDMEIVIGFPKG